MLSEGVVEGPTTAPFARLPLVVESGLCHAPLNEGEAIYGLRFGVSVLANALEVRSEEAGQAVFSRAKASRGRGRLGQAGRRRVETS